MVAGSAPGVLLEGLEHLPAPLTVFALSCQPPQVVQRFNSLRTQLISGGVLLHSHAQRGVERDSLRGQPCIRSRQIDLLSFVQSADGQCLLGEAVDPASLVCV